LPVNTDVQIPFLPQTSTSNAILAAISLANEHYAQNRQLALQQAAQPSQIAEREATAKRLESQTQLEQLQIQQRKELIGALTGNTPGSVPTQDTVAPASSATGSALAPTGITNEQQVAMYPGSDLAKAIAADKNPSPAPAAAKAPAQGGLIGQTLDGLLNDPTLKPQERNALMTAGRQAMLKAYLDPQTAMDSITTTYNDILRMHGEMERTIHSETVPDSQSSTGYSQVATHADGTEAYRHIAPAPLPKNLEEASAFLGSAAFNFQRAPTDGNKSALTLAQTQHDLAYQDRISEAARQAQATAMAQGKDYEAMLRTGKNPITKEVLNLNNAPPSALVNPTTGQVIPQDMISLYKPNQNERQTADTARQVLAISQDLQNEITKNPKLIGPLAGRSQEALQSLGISGRDASKLIDDVTFLQSAATKMHTGRFSNAILDKMSGVIKPGMNAKEFLGALDSVNDVANRYANEDKLTTVYEFQQRQQFENQGPSGANPFVPGQFSPSNPFAPKKQ
jgi:hypothetical protein